MKKKFLLKELLVSFMLLCTAHMWAYDFEVDNIQYTVISLDDLTAEVSGLTDTNVAKINIPETVEYKSRTLTVTSIGEKAFYECTELTSVSLPSTLTSIGSYAFYKCSSLEGLTIPNSVTSVGSYAFAYCSRLTSVNIPDLVTKINEAVFERCSSLKEITIPNSVTSIGTNAFASCTGFTEIVIPNSVKSIGSWAFYNCEALKTFDIPNSVTSLGEYALRGCNSIECLYIGVGLGYVCEHFEAHSTEYAYYYPLLWGGAKQDDAPTKMNSIVLKDDSSSFSMRGYGYETWSTPQEGYPIFSNIDVQYCYVGRPLVDIKEWTYRSSNTDRPFAIKISQPYGTIGTLEIGGYCTDVPYFYQSIANLILGEDVETYTVKNIYQGELASITCKSTTPPALTGTFDTSTYVNTVLYVPKGCKTTYESTEGWKDFWDIIEADVSGIDDIVNSGEVTEVGRYTISGQKITTPQKGINIVRYSDGTTRKILVQ